MSTNTGNGPRQQRKKFQNCEWGVPSGGLGELFICELDIPPHKDVAPEVAKLMRARTPGQSDIPTSAREGSYDHGKARKGSDDHSEARGGRDEHGKARGGDQ